jgi:hypothetical protein
MRIATANRVDGPDVQPSGCASHTTVRTGLVYGGSQYISKTALYTSLTFCSRLLVASKL